MTINIILMIMTVFVFFALKMYERYRQAPLYNQKLLEHTHISGLLEFKPVGNWQGVPRPGLTLEEVSENVKFFNKVWLDNCPNCGVRLLDYKSAWWDFEEGYIDSFTGATGQYDVTGVYCPKGHYTNLSHA